MNLHYLEIQMTVVFPLLTPHYFVKNSMCAVILKEGFFTTVYAMSDILPGHIGVFALLPVHSFSQTVQ